MSNRRSWPTTIRELAADLARLNSDEERLEGMEDELASARQDFVQAAGP